MLAQARVGPHMPAVIGKLCDLEEVAGSDFFGAWHEYVRRWLGRHERSAGE